MMPPFTRKDVAKITGLSDRRVLFYTEQNVLPDVAVTVGRGNAREYSRLDIFYLTLLQELKVLGLSLSSIRRIIGALGRKIGDNPQLLGFSGEENGPGAGFTRIHRFLVISFMQGPDGNPGSGSKEYSGKLLLYFPEGSTDLAALSGEPAKIVVDLNPVFKKVRW